MRATTGSDLASALVDEVNTLEELRASLGAQRDAVARNDAESIETSLQALSRTLLTLEEARRRRHSLVVLLAGQENVALADLELYLGSPLEPELEEARASVRRVAAAAAHDLSINQHVLDRAFQAGDAFLQRLFSSAGAGYNPDHHTEPSRHAVLVDKTA